MSARLSGHRAFHARAGQVEAGFADGPIPLKVEGRAHALTGVAAVDVLVVLANRTGRAELLAGLRRSSLALDVDRLLFSRQRRVSQSANEQAVSIDDAPLRRQASRACTDQRVGCGARKTGLARQR